MATEKRRSRRRSASQSKQSSGSSPGRPELPPVFVDRSLGKDILDGLRAAGFADVRHMADVYEHDGMFVPDEDWLRDCAKNGWVALSKDSAIARVHRELVEKEGTTVFLLPDAEMSGQQQLDRFARHKYRIAMRSAKPGAAIYKLYSKSVVRIGP